MKNDWEIVLTFVNKRHTYNIGRYKALYTHISIGLGLYMAKPWLGQSVGMYL